jgi:hypothetical protein
MTLPDSPTVPFEVVPYSKAKLEQLLVTFSDSSSSIARKLHLDYFEGYFGQIGAQAIIIEHDYVDRDFLEDHAAYYVRCFQPYKRYCRRLHFFRCEVTQESFSKALNGDTDGVPIDTLQEKYLGFVVVKPLPTTVVGRTCLTTYESAGRRYFPIARDYDANLFGISLKIRNTLAFQEQDSVVAACATSALWSVFHGTGKLFQHPIPPPVAITKNHKEPTRGGVVCNPTFKRWVWIGSLDVWDDVIIGKGNKGNTSIHVFQIEGKHSISSGGSHEQNGRKPSDQRTTTTTQDAGSGCEGLQD